MLDERCEADVELRLEGNRKVADSHVVEVSLVIDGLLLRGEAAASTFRAAADEVVDKLERRTVDAKERPRDRRRAEQVRYSRGSAAERRPGRPEREVAEDVARRQGQALRHRAHVRGGRHLTDGGAGPYLLHLRQRRE